MNRWTKLTAAAATLTLTSAIILAALGDPVMNIETQTQVRAPADRTWTLFGEQFGEVSAWAAAFESSSLDGPLVEGAIRTISLKPGSGLSGVITQALTKFEPEARTLAYEMRTGMPKPLRAIRNEWTIVPDGADGCRLTGCATFTLAWWARPLTPLLRKKMSQSLESFASEFASYAVSAS